MLTRFHAGLLVLPILSACASGSSAHLPVSKQLPDAGQPAVQSCTDTSPASVPIETVPGLREGPHTFILEGVRLWYCVAGRSAGDVPPVVFLHGGPGEGSYRFASLMGRQLEPSLRMVYFDQRGSGRSERPWTGDYAWDRLIADIEGLRRALGVPRIAIVAHSFGVALALEYAAKHPEHVSSMVLTGGLSDVAASSRSQCERLAQVNPEAHARAQAAVEGGSKGPGDCNVLKGVTGADREAFFQGNMFPDPATAERVKSVDAGSGLRNTGELGRALFSSGLLQWRFTAHDRLTMPVLVVAGQHDYQTGLEAQRQLVDPLPKGRLLVYERSGHFMYIDEPDRFARDVTDFLTGTPGRE